MSSISISIEIDAPVDEVWRDVADLGSHVEWMADAESITFTSESTTGAGTVFDCETKVGPIRLTDKMTVTEWVTGQTIGVRHEGLVTGEGRFTLEPVSETRTRFSWAEDLTFPWWMGGGVGGYVARPVLTAIWRRNLKRLAARF